MLNSPDSSKTAEQTKKSPLKPKEIQGLEQVLAQKRVGLGNRIDIAGIINGGEEKTLQAVRSTEDEPHDVIFHGILNMKQMTDMIKAGEEPLPFFVSEVDVMGDGQESLVLEAVRGHNALKIIEFMENGGDVNLVPQENPLIPAVTEVQDYLKGQQKEDKKAITDRVRAAFGKKAG
ncbi:MAG: hypothetical protein ACM3IJ_04010 [Candidatus Levyibacteriota bacterium]